MRVVPAVVEAERDRDRIVVAVVAPVGHEVRADQVADIEAADRDAEDDGALEAGQPTLGPCDVGDGRSACKRRPRLVFGIEFFHVR